MATKRKIGCKVNKTAARYAADRAKLAAGVFGLTSGTVKDLRAAAKLLRGAKTAKVDRMTYTRRELSSFMGEVAEDYSQPIWRGVYRNVAAKLKC